MFTRVDEGGRCEFHLLPASGGASRAIGPCDRLNGRYDWLPDGSGIVAGLLPGGDRDRSEEHTSELQSLMRSSYAVFCLKKKTNKIQIQRRPSTQPSNQTTQNDTTRNKKSDSIKH